jgi:hypothetical protein
MEVINGLVINGTESGKLFYASISDDIVASETVPYIITGMMFYATIADAITASETLPYVWTGTVKSTIGDAIEIAEVTASKTLQNVNGSTSDSPSISETITYEKKNSSSNDVVDRYKDLLILQYRQKTRARATVDLFVRSIVSDLFSMQVQDSFNFDYAIGIQLDLLGKYIGVERRVKTFTGQIALTDDEYRFILYLKRFINIMGSSMDDFQTLVNNYSNSALKVFDHQDMTMSWMVDSSKLSSDIVQVIISNGLLPRPCGVSYSSVVSVIDLSKIFGFQMYADTSVLSVGFNSYSDFHSDWYMIKYSDAITIP